MNEVSAIIDRMQNGDPQAAADLLPLVYDDLRKRAAKLVDGESTGQSLDATALVHEAYLNLVGDHRFADRRHFFRVAAEAMRRILVDRARKRERLRHGAGRGRVPLSVVEPAVAARSEEILALDEALERFAALDPLKAELVKLRYFAGLSEAEAAAALEISRPTASRYWAFARAWLLAAMDGKKGSASES
jgi:RNA polymerase sigma factor (TIGR02999 family)